MRRVITLCLLLAACGVSFAKDNFIYVMDRAFGPPLVTKVDLPTGATVDTYTNLSGYAGRGLQVVGDTMYYTAVEESCPLGGICGRGSSAPGAPGLVYSYTLSTHTDHGLLFKLPSGVAAIAFDGTDFYFADNTGANKVYKYTMTGTLLETITLPLCVGGCAILEYFEHGNKGYLVANRGRVYDLYDLSGGVVEADFIDPRNGDTSSESSIVPTGIAFDGKHFYTGGYLGNDLFEWNMYGKYLRKISMGATAVDDMSFNFVQKGGGGGS